MTDFTPQDTSSFSEKLSGALESLQNAMREARESCDLHITVEGRVVPLADCDWVLISPCMHAQSLMSAVHLDGVIASEGDAWHEMYDIAPHAHKRVREREIKKMKEAGWTIRSFLRQDAVILHKISMKECGKNCPKKT
jgi:hypothetical protein